MSHTKNLISTACMILMLWAAVEAFSFAQERSPTDSDRTPLLSGFEDLQIGMENSVLRKRRLLTPLNKNGGDHIVFVETGVGGKYFDRALYTFAASTNRLEWFTLFSEREPAYIKAHYEDFIASCITQWGSEYGIVLHKMRHSKQEYVGASLVWEKGEYVVVASFTPIQQLPKLRKGTFQVKVLPAAMPFRDGMGILKEFTREELDVVRSIVGATLGDSSGR